MEWLVRVSVLKGCPRPWFVSGVKDKAILWAALVHLLSLFPEHRAVTAVARVVASAVDALESPPGFTALVSIMSCRAFPTVCVLGFAFSTLVAELVAPETSDRLLVRASRFHSFIEDVRTLLEDRIC